MKQDIEFLRATAILIKSGSWWKMGTTATARELDEIADRLDALDKRDMTVSLCPECQVANGIKRIPMRGKVNGADRKLRR